MNVRHVWSVFVKDGRELLRDRRTLFINAVLPALLYPLLMVFGLQVAQVVKAQPQEDLPVLTLGLPPALTARLAEVPAATASAAALMPRLTVLDLQVPAAPAALTAVAERCATGATTAHAQALALLRREGAVAALVALPPSATSAAPRLVVLLDDAHPRGDRVAERLERVLEQHRRALLLARLAVHGLGPEALTPVVISTTRLAPTAETLRVRLAAVVPLLLVLLAVSGAFLPAVDLIAGERERGTLETLLSLPVDRRDLFLGKLLVTVASSAGSVVLNLLSLGATMAIGLSALGPMGAALGVQDLPLSLLLLVFVALLPLTVAVSALALAVTGLAASAKEAQNLLAPLVLVSLVLAMGGLFDARPSAILDLIPVTGAVIALKEALQAPSVPWGHLLLSTGTSLVLAMVVVGWAARRFDDESFRYPGLVRAGWGRWRRWGATPAAPGGVEVLGVYAISVAAFVAVSGLVQQAHPALMVTLPLLAVATPALLHRFLGAYPAATTLHWVAPPRRAWPATLLAIPAAIALSIALGQMQAPFFPDGGAGTEEAMRAVLDRLRADGGLVLLIACIALAPAICEELLCRGTLLAGLRRSLGVRSAVLVSAFLFAALHLQPDRFMPQAILGVVLAMLVLRTGSVWPAILLHFGHNAGVVLLALTVEQWPELTVWPSANPWFATGVALLSGTAGLVLALAFCAPTPRAQWPSVNGRNTGEAS